MPTIEELILGRPLEEKITEEEVQEIVKGNLQEEVLSPEGAAEILGATQEVEYVPIPDTTFPGPEELDIQGWVEKAVQGLIEAHRLPPEMVGVEGEVWVMSEPEYVGKSPPREELKVGPHPDPDWEPSVVGLLTVRTPYGSESTILRREEDPPLQIETKPFESIQVQMELLPKPEDLVEEVGFDVPAPCEAPAPKVSYDLVESVPTRAERVVLIDGSNLAMRCFFPLRDMCRRDGKPTGLLYGILKAVRNLQRECNALPVFVWDAGGSAKKREIYLDYKGNREYSEVHDNCFKQLKDVKEYLRCTGLPQAWVQGEEADDVIASLACRNFKGQFVFVYSNDDDFMQLVDDQHIIVVKPTKEGPEFYDSEKVEERMGVPPEQVPEYRALRGDKSDNLPGAFRVAGKVLVAQVQEHGSLEKMYESEANLGKLTPKQKETLWGHKEQAFLNRKLMLLDRGMDCQLEVSPFDSLALHELFEEMEFFSYLSEFEEWVKEFEGSRGFSKVGNL